MTKLFIINFFFFNLMVSGQHDSLNRFTDQGKKHKYWIQYLDSLAYPTDSANSYFYGFDLYDDGQGVFLFSNRNTSWKKYKLNFTGKLPEKGKPVPIDGAFKWYINGSQVLNEEIYKNGKPFYYKSSNYSKGDPLNPSFSEVLYFDKLYNNVPGTFYYEEYNNGKLARKYWFYKGRKGWRSYRIKEK